MPGTRYHFAYPSRDLCLQEQSLERQSQENVFLLHSVRETGLLRPSEESNVQPPKSNTFSRRSSASKNSGGFAFTEKSAIEMAEMR